MIGKGFGFLVTLLLHLCTVRKLTSGAMLIRRLRFRYPLRYQLPRSRDDLSQKRTDDYHHLRRYVQSSNNPWGKHYIKFNGNSLFIPHELSEVIGKVAPLRRERFRWDPGNNSF